MKFQLSKHFGVVEDQFSITDPWGFGLTLTLWSKDSRRHRDWMRQQARSSPATLALNSAAAKAGMRSAATGEKVTSDEVIQSVIDKLDLTAEQVDRMMRGAFHEAVELIADWSGPAVTDAETGKPIPCNHANKVALLDDPTPIRPDLEHAGRVLGDVLVELIHAACDERSKARDEFLETSGKGSASTSAGDSAPNPATPEAG